jgi:hypothetical protein
MSSTPTPPPPLTSAALAAAVQQPQVHLLSDFLSAAFSPPAFPVRLAGILRQGLSDAHGVRWPVPRSVTLSGRSSAAETLQSRSLLHPRCVLSLRRSPAIDSFDCNMPKCSFARRAALMRVVAGAGINRVGCGAAPHGYPASQTTAFIQPATSRFPPRVLP